MNNITEQVTHRPLGVLTYAESWWDNENGTWGWSASVPAVGGSMGVADSEDAAEHAANFARLQLQRTAP